jgi:hypothetical protein
MTTQAVSAGSTSHADALRVRKRQLAEADLATTRPLPANEIDLAACAAVLYSAEDLSHPIEHLLDGSSGRGATRWSSGRQNASEQIAIEFDRPMQILRMIFDAEERQVERTQQVTIEYSSDSGKTYRVALLQEYTFSPQGSTYQREDLGFALRDVTHLRLTVLPNKGVAGMASLTSIRLFG